MCCGKTKCLEPISSECVFYEGKPLKVIPHKENCDKDFSEVIFDIDTIFLKAKTDLSTLDKKCLDITLEGLTQKQLNQALINKVCTTVSAPEENDTFDEDVANVILDVNCNLNNCQPNNMSLKNLIQGLCTEINTLKQQVNLLQTNNANNQYIPNV